MISDVRLTETNGQAAEPTAPAQAARLLWTLKELAVMLGRPKRSLERDLAAGRIGPRPIRNLGRAIRFSAREIEAWIAAGCPPARAWRARQGEANRSG
jgi:predicted DNA-binding transcriptional regulator AlpA